MTAYRTLCRGMTAAAFLMALLHAPAWAQTQVIEIPPDPRDTLNELDQKLLDKQREIFAAQQHGDTPAVERLDNEYQQIQLERSHAISRAKHLF